MAEILWDGISRGYMPPDELIISPKLNLHTKGTAEVDPITYEVVRNTLLNINFEHGQTIQKLSISPITMLSRDLQCALLTENGDVMCLGPFLLYLGNMQGLTTKWILENRSEDPGIEDGDIFMCNDPYVGTAHQQDTCLSAPVFWQGELFCWVANTVHYSDLGGSVPGSFCVGSKDMFEDPICIPPLKLVERGHLRVDIEQLFLRQSRVPHELVMDLHAAIAGINVAKERMLKLIDSYGPDMVKSIMYRIMDAGERAFAEKLSLIPDGRWSERVYTEAAFPGDRGIYVSQVNITKKEGYLYIDNEGTSPQVGGINNTFAGFLGGVMAAVNVMLAYDLAGASGGITRRIKWRPVPGTITCADWPAPTSAAGQYNMPMVVSTATGAVAKMISCAGEPLRREAIGMPDVHANGGCISNGINRNGYYFVGMNSGMANGSFPATLGEDGFISSGVFFVPGMEASNVEENEMAYPLLTLYRRHNCAGAAGAGFHRSGLGVEEAWLMHGTDRINLEIYNNESFTKCQGLMGGNPGGRAFFRVRKNTDVRSQFELGIVPQNIDALAGEEIGLVFKGPRIVVGVDDIWSTNAPNTAGYGDPLDRAPAAVATDVTDGRMTAKEAEAVFGVIIGEEGNVNTESTIRCREKQRASRSGKERKK